MAAPLLSVVVPVLDDAAGLRACLDALLPAADASVEVVVVDNGSRDASLAVARAHPLGPTVLCEPRRGSYAARNAGAAAARGAALAFTDADCRPAPDWVPRGLAALSAAAVVGGTVTADTSAAPGVWERYDSALYLDQADLVRQGFAATANLWVRRPAWESVGPFDPALRSSGDLEWGRRAGRHGLGPVHAPDVRVTHRPRRTAAATWALHRRLGAGWAVLHARGEWPPVWADPALRPALGAAVQACGLRRRQVAPVHALALAARWTGRLTGR